VAAVGGPWAIVLARRGWLVPCAILAGVLLGFLTSAAVRPVVDPSGIVQSTLSTPLPEQIDAGLVAEIVGLPFAALAAALIASLGLPRAPAWPYAVAGVVAAVVVMGLVTVEAVPIGAWWLHRLPTDTNRTAAYVSGLLVPPAALALLLAARALAPPAPPADRAGPMLRLTLLGSVLGLFLGALFGGTAAVITWAASCPQSGLTNCFTVSSVLSGGTVIGSFVGIAAGTVCGAVAWLVRPRDPHRTPASA